jgi:hypothetical protein
MSLMSMYLEDDDVVPGCDTEVSSLEVKVTESSAECTGDATASVPTDPCSNPLRRSKRLSKPRDTTNRMVLSIVMPHLSVFS